MLNSAELELDPSTIYPTNELIASLDLTNLSLQDKIAFEIYHVNGPVRDEFSTALSLSLIYSLILFTGVIGNICTCIVIVKNKYLHTSVNYYLISLACSDLLLLILGLPQEM